MNVGFNGQLKYLPPPNMNEKKMHPEKEKMNKSIILFFFSTRNGISNRSDILVRGVLIIERLLKVYVSPHAMWGDGGFGRKRIC